MVRQESMQLFFIYVFLFIKVAQHEQQIRYGFFVKTYVQCVENHVPQRPCVPEVSNGQGFFLAIFMKSTISEKIEKKK